MNMFNLRLYPPPAARNHTSTLLDHITPNYSPLLYYHLTALVPQTVDYAFVIILDEVVYSTARSHLFYLWQYVENI